MVGHTGSIYSEAAAQQDYMQAIFAILRRRWISILFCALVLTGLLTTAIQFLPRSYRAISSVEVLSKTPLVANPDVYSSSEAFTDETAGTELGIFESPELRTAVIRKLDLLDNSEFNPNLKPSLLAWALAYVRASPIAHYLPADWLTPPPPPSADKVLFDTTETFASRVKAEPVSHSKIIQVSVLSRDPQLAARIANETVAEYVTTHQRQKIAAYAEAYSFAQQRLPALKADMEAKSAAVDRFRQEHNMVSGQYAAIRRESLSEASKQVVDAQNKLEALRAQAAQAKIGDPMTNPAVLASLTIQRLREQKSQIMAEAASRPAAWQSNYAQRATAVDGQIRAEAGRIVASLPGQVAAQDAAVKSQLVEYETIQREVSEMDQLQSRLDPLENDARIAVKQYNDFKSSDSATKPDVAFVGVNVRVLSRAAVPYRAYFPNNKLMIPAAAVLAFGCVTAISLYAGRRTGFSNTLQLQDSLQMAPVGRIPFRTKRMERAFWESLMALSMRLLPPYSEHITKHTILVTSAQPNEGKTTIARGLADTLAQRNISVALIDADMRVVRTSRRGQPPTAPGLGDVLLQALTLDDVVVKRSGVSLVPAGKLPANATALIASSSMAHLLAALRAQHDIVIIDGPPALVGGDVYALARLASRVLFVIKQSDTNQRHVDEALGAIDRPAKDIAIVLNMIRSTGDDNDELAFSPRMMEYYASSASYYAKS